MKYIHKSNDKIGISTLFWHSAKVYFMVIRPVWWLITEPNMNEINNWAPKLRSLTISSVAFCSVLFVPKANYIFILSYLIGSFTWEDTLLNLTCASTPVCFGFKLFVNFGNLEINVSVEPVREYMYRVKANLVAVPHREYVHVPHL